MQKKSYLTHLPFLSLLLAFMLIMSCSNPVVQQNAAAPGGESEVSRGYIHGDNIAPSQLPPGGHRVDEVPQFIVLGFDDNSGDSGINWVVDHLKARRNPAGSNNRYTYDGRMIGAAFYFSSINQTANKEAWKRAVQAGFEPGNHSESHPHGAGLTEMEWYDEILNGTRNLIFPYNGIGIEFHDVYGFRAPYLEYNAATFKAMKSAAIRYDCSIEEGWQAGQDGTNQFWPYTLDNGSPADPTIGTVPALWEIPIYVLTVPPDSECAAYGIPAGLRAKLAARKPGEFSEHDGKVTGYLSELLREFVMTKDEALATLKYSLDLKLKGNRAPLTLGADSTDFVDPLYQTVLKEFLDYALTRQDVRVVSGSQLYDWMRMPISLIEKPDVVAPTTPGNLRLVKKTGMEMQVEWSISDDDRKVVGYIVGLNSKDLYKTNATTTKATFSNLTPDTTYDLVIAAYDAAGNRSVPAVLKAKTTDNHPPEVTLTAPLDGTIMVGPQLLVLKADATDDKGDITAVGFVVDGEMVAIDREAPYEAEWIPHRIGTFKVEARAYDGEGLFSTSAPVLVHIDPRPVCTLAPWKAGAYTGGQEVCHNGRHWRAKWWTQEEPGVNNYAPWVELGPCPGDGKNTPPRVKILQPINSGRYEPYKPIEILVDAIDDFGVAKVELRVNGMKICAPDFTPPYSFEWTPTRDDYFNIDVFAYDTDGAYSVASVRIMVLYKPVRLPHVEFTAPINGESFEVGSAVNLAVDVSADEAIEKVDFFVDKVKVGTDLEAPYSLPWTPDSVGSYELVAVATNIYGAPGTSQPVTVKVVEKTPPVDEWKPNVYYNIGDIIIYNGKKWRCEYPHIGNPTWPPGGPGIWFWVAV